MRFKSTESAWKHLFVSHNILRSLENNGFFDITAGQINECREARLMTKFDSSTQLPSLFHKNGLSILPTARGKYRIGYYEAYQPLTYPQIPAKRIIAPDYCQTLDCTNLYSEASALSFAFNSGIINDVMQTEKAHYTVSGRMSSGHFDFIIKNKHSGIMPYTLSVTNAQIEIDAGYESAEAFYLVEAKNTAPDDFLIRQLYYPYRLWRAKISKPIFLVFLVFSNDIFTTFTYEWTEDSSYNALRLIETKRYTLADDSITHEELVRICDTVTPGREPPIQFPQANSFERIIDLLSILFEKNLSRAETTTRYVFNERQTNYYVDACRYLGLLDKYTKDTIVYYRLTPEARELMSKAPKQKTLGLIAAILSRPVFNEVFKTVLRSQQMPDLQKITGMMRKTTFSIKINETTMYRRASTVRQWITWILAQRGL